MKDFLFILAAMFFYCCSPVNAQQYLEKQSIKSTNFISNPGFESGKTSWLISSGTTVALETVNPLQGVQSLKFTPTAVSQTVATPLLNLKCDDKCEASVRYFSDASVNPIVFKVLNASGTVVASTTLTQTVSFSAVKTLIFPNISQGKAVFESVGAAFATYLDSVHLGSKASGLSDSADIIAALGYTPANQTDLDTVSGTVAALDAATLKKAANLSDVASATVARNNLGLGSVATESIVPIAKGGTGSASATVGFNNLGPSTTKGDLIVHDGTNNIRFPVGTNARVLTADSSKPSGLDWAPVVVTTDTNPVIYYKTTAQSIPNASATVVNFDAIRRDPSVEVTTGTNWRFTPTVSGTYLVATVIQFASANYGLNVIFEANLFKNGANPQNLGYLTHQNGSATQAPLLIGSTTIGLDPSLGDYIDVRAYQNTGGSQPLMTGHQYSRISIMRVGPL